MNMAKSGRAAMWLQAMCADSANGMGIGLTGAIEEVRMPRGDKSSYTGKQKRQAQHIEEGYEERGLSEDEAERRAWATVNKMTGGGKKSGSGRGKKINKEPARKGGRLGGAATKKRPGSKKRVATKKTTGKKAAGKKTGGKNTGGKKTTAKRSGSKKRSGGKKR